MIILILWAIVFLIWDKLNSKIGIGIEWPMIVCFIIMVIYFLYWW